jgi:hypothetical protein
MSADSMGPVFDKPLPRSTFSARAAGRSTQYGSKKISRSEADEFRSI